MSEPPQRRSTDRVDPDVLLAINEGDAENRHLLRNEFAEAIVLLRVDLAAIKQDVQVGNLADRTEFAQLQAKQLEHTTDILELRRLEPRVASLEAKSLAGEEVAKLKRWFVGFALGIPAAILAATVFLAQHVH